MAEILLKQATKKYLRGKVTAVNSLDLKCADKEFLAILGPSGAGKTSTLKMISGIEDLTEGELFIGGVNMTDAPSQNRNVSMVFEGYALYPHMSVRENLAFPLKAPTRSKKLTKEEINAKVEEWAKIVGLEELLDRKPSQLSGGQRQRVSLARALVRSPEPNVILMDEPIAHLDAKLRHSMRAELKRLHQDLGATIIYVTHDYEEAMAMADRIMVINNGILMQEGSPREIYEDPANEFVASTVGDPPMNFLNGEVRESNGEYYFYYAKEEPIRIGYEPESTGNADLGIRPSEIVLYHDPDIEGAIHGVINHILPTGAKQIVEINASNRMVLVKSRRDLSYKVGDHVSLEFPPERVCLFDPESKARIYGREKREDG